MRRLLRLARTLAVVTASVAPLPMQNAVAADSAVIFMYHHVADDTPASTSVSPQRFAEQLQWLEDNDFAVLPLAPTLTALRRGESVPENAVVITFDDGYESVQHAAAQLQARDWPFTIFVSTDYIDGSYSGYLSWDELRSLAERGASIGNHTRTHASLVRRREGESGDNWRARAAEEITAAARRLETELGDAAIPVLAWPYGEYDVATKRIAAELGLTALGQHSGAAGAGTDWLAVPRFPVATGYDALEDFALRARSRPLVIELLGAEQHISDGRQPALEAVLRDSAVRRDALACYAGGQGAMALEWIDAARGHFVARPNAPLQPGRTKYNCTAPSATRDGVYHWFGYLWMTKRPDGSWYPN